MAHLVEVAGLIYVTAYFICLWHTAKPGSLRVRAPRR